MTTNPTNAVDVNFLRYAAKRKNLVGAHMSGGIPDYAYGVDYDLMRKMKAIPGLYRFARAMTNQLVPYQKQLLNLECLKVGPSQYSDIYEMTKNCARTLGIGIPEVFIEPKPAIINAYTIASEMDAPVMCLTSAFVERLTYGELKFVIGHECGHIHNNHTIFTTAAQVVLGGLAVGIPGISELLAIVTAPIRLAMSAWSRASEVTADRAGVICVDNFDDAIIAEAKFMYGAAFTKTEIDLDAVLKQYDRARATPVRMLELHGSHPIAVRRILAMKEFMNSEALYKWRPECKEAGMKLFNKQELDARCEKYIGVTKNEKRAEAK